jgi:hypothetical protein
LLQGFLMIRDGQYAAWFRTSLGEGTGIVRIADGKISGGDSFFTYGGSYDLVDDRFTAVLTTRRHAAGPPTVFGLDEVEVKLAGKIQGTTARCTGVAEQVPGIAFEATLFLGQEASPAPCSDRATPIPNLGRLPSGPDSRARTRNPFPRGLTQP